MVTGGSWQVEWRWRTTNVELRAGRLVPVSLPYHLTTYTNYIMTHTGHCLCGAVKVTVASKHDTQIVCHCLDCQQTSGSAFSTNILAPQTDVTLDGPTKSYESKALSGNVITRIFCPTCGAALAHKSAAFGPAMAVQTASMADFRKTPIDTELFVKDRWTGLAAINGAAQVNTMPGA